MLKYKFDQYLIYYCIILCFLLIPILCNYLLLRNAGELLTSEEIYNLQHAKKLPNQNLYGSGLFNDVHDLKIFSYNKLRPKIITLGSSRVLQFRENLFKKDFYNMGRIMASISDGFYFLPIILKDHKPDIIVLNIDYWWFNDLAHKTKYKYEQTYDLKNSLQSGHLLLPFKWLVNRKITIYEYFKLIFNRYFEGIGIIGKISGNGFRSDGSYSCNVRKITNNILEENVFMKNQGNFKYNSFVSDEHYNKFIELIKYIINQNIKLILFIPPVAPLALAEMKKYNYSYIDKLRNRFSNDNIMVYDYHDPQEKFAETSDCEFIDIVHGGDVLYARILQDLAQHEPELTPYVNSEFVANVIENFSGFTMYPDLSITTEK